MSWTSTLPPLLCLSQYRGLEPAWRKIQAQNQKGNILLLYLIEEQNKIMNSHKQ